MFRIKSPERRNNRKSPEKIFKDKLFEKFQKILKSD